MIVPILTIISILTILIFAIATAKQSRFHQAKKSFVILVVFLILWSIINYASFVFKDRAYGIWVVRGVLFFATLLTYSFFNFVYTFPTERPLARKYRFSLTAAAFIVAMFCLTPNVFVRLENINGNITTITKPGVYIFALTVVSFILSGLVILFRRFRQKQGIERMQIGYIALGFGLMFLLILVFNFFAVAFAQKTQYVQLGSVYTLPFVAATAYAMIRYRLLDIVIVIRKSLVQFVTFVLLFAIYAYALLLVQRSTSSTFTLSSNTSLLITIFIIGLTIEPLRKGIYKFIDGIVANREKDRHEALKRMQLMAASTMQFQTLVERTQNELGKTFGIKVDFLLAERRVQALTQFPAGQMKVQLEDVVGQRITSGRVLIGDELPYRIENGETSLKVVHDWMQANDVSAIVPIGAGEDMVGAFLFRGTGKVVYTADMVRFMKDFQEQSIFAFASAYAYKLAVERIGVRQ